MCTAYHGACNQQPGSEHWKPAYGIGSYVNYFSRNDDSEFYYLHRLEIVAQRFCSKEDRWYYCVISAELQAGFILPEDNLFLIPALAFDRKYYLTESFL